MEKIGQSIDENVLIAVRDKVFGNSNPETQQGEDTVFVKPEINIDDEIEGQLQEDSIKVEENVMISVKEETFNEKNPLDGEDVDEEEEVDESDSSLDGSCSDSSEAKSKTQTKTDKKPKYECDKCEKVYTHLLSYEFHMTAKHSSKRYKCSQCPKTFQYKNSRYRHERMHLPPEELNVHPCPICDKKFAFKCLVAKHMSAHRNVRRSTKILIDETEEKKLIEEEAKMEQDSIYYCKICQKDFSTRMSYKIHMEAIHSLAEYPCSFCPKIFNYKNSLYRHERMHRIDPDMLYIHPCPVCSKKFAFKSEVKQHVKRFHRNVSLPSETTNDGVKNTESSKDRKTKKKPKNVPKKVPKEPQTIVDGSGEQQEVYK